MGGRNKEIAFKKLKDQKELFAGNFSIWLSEIQKSFIDDTGIKVPCGNCRACCTSSLFVLIKHDEKETLRNISKNVLFNAPGMMKGNMLLGYDKDGFCPMYKKGNCSIYNYRPQTCQNFDCRIYTAAGITSEQEIHSPIIKHSMRWKFHYATESDLKTHSAIKTAAKFIIDNKESFPNCITPTDLKQIAIVSIKAYQIFIELEKQRKNKKILPSNSEIAKYIIAVNNNYDSTFK